MRITKKLVQRTVEVFNEADPFYKLNNLESPGVYHPYTIDDAAYDAITGGGEATYDILQTQSLTEIIPIIQKLGRRAMVDVPYYRQIIEKRHETIKELSLY
jgi:hypothetical protein